MAAGAGYIEFTTGDILTATAANEYLASQVVMVFASASARTSAIASPQEGMVSYLKDTNAIEYYSGSAWTAVGGGGGGKVLQVVQATTSTTVGSNATTYTDSGLSGTITPSATTSKILIMTFQAALLTRATSSDASARMNLVRNSTEIVSGLAQTIAFGSDVELSAVINFNYLDSPATTSATTYKTQQKSGSTSHYITNQPSSQPSYMILMEIGA